MQIESFSCNMQEKLKRNLISIVKEELKKFPAVAILGPRQSGKSTLAGMLLSKVKGSVYIDLEKPSDLRKIEDCNYYIEHPGFRGLACG